jgi:hypothetical protein
MPPDATAELSRVAPRSRPRAASAFAISHRSSRRSRGRRDERWSTTSWWRSSRFSAATTARGAKSLRTAATTLRRRSSTERSSTRGLAGPAASRPRPPQHAHRVFAAHRPRQGTWSWTPSVTVSGSGSWRAPEHRLRWCDVGTARSWNRDPFATGDAVRALWPGTPVRRKRAGGGLGLETVLPHRQRHARRARR